MLPAQCGPCRRVILCGILVLVGLAVMPPNAASASQHLSLAQVRSVLRTSHGPPDLRNADLSRLDLSGLNFRQADLRGANLLEAVLLNANLSGVKLDNANLSSVKMAHASLRHASLRNATFLTTMESVSAEGADFSGASGYIIAPDANLAGAHFRGAQLASDMRNQPMGLLHTILARANLSGADLRSANLANADAHSANFGGANCTKASFMASDLGAANFNGANVSAANFARANLDGATFIGVIGRATMKGLASALNRDQAIFRR